MTERPATLTLTTIAVVLAMVCVSPLVAAEERGAARTPPTDLPVLNWEPRSDWVNVRDLGAKGDGKTDDTAAIQKALDGVGNGSTVYLPPGTYRVTKTLTLTGPLIGVLVVGHGRDTKLVWGGERGGRLWLDDGVAYSRYVGLTFEGQGEAAVGFLHHSDNRFETEVLHRHLAFRNFTDAGILADPKDKYALAETVFENCLFEDCRRGVAFVSFNDYDYTFDGCEFRRCDLGIECRHGNFYARNTHFEQSRVVDIRSQPEHASSVRRCTSVGSKAFLEHANPVAPLTVQDCHVSGWTNPGGAMTLSGAPVMMFDCVFTDPPGNKAPVRAPRAGQRLVVSENRTEGGGEVLQPSHKARVYVIPAGRRTGAIRSAQRRLFRGTAEIPTEVLDAKRDFGAKGDGKTDDTAAIQKMIDATREHGNGALAYLPTGRYVISDTIRITGRDYFVGGSGFRTSLVWRGAEGGTMIAVHDPQNVVLENLAIGNHDSGQMNNGIDVLHTGSEAPSRMTYDGVFVYGMYQKQPFRKGMHFTGLGENAVVVMKHVQGNLRFTDSARATILGNVTYEGSLVVEGKDKRRDGLLGFLTRLSTLTTHGLYVRDNHSLVMSDFYVEQADSGYVFEGGAGDPEGRVTIQGAKLHFTVPKEAPDKGAALTIRNYSGQIFIGPNQFYVEPTSVRVVHEGRRPLDLFLLASCFYRTRLEPTVDDSAHVLLLGNEAVGFVDKEKKVSPAAYKAEDNVSAEQPARVSRALDDLRRVGEADLRLNHGQP